MKKLEIAIIVLSLMVVAFVFGCEKEPVTAVAQFEAELVEAELDWWAEKDENGVTTAERMAQSNREYERRAAERKWQAYEAAIEREAEIQARAALKLIELMKDKEQ